MNKYIMLSAILLSAFMARLLAYGASIGDALVIMSLSSLYFGLYYKKGHEEKPLDQDIKDRVVELENSLKATKDKVSSFSFGSSLKK